MSGMPEMEFGCQKEVSGSKVCEKETSGTFNTCYGKWTCFVMWGGGPCDGEFYMSTSTAPRSPSYIISGYA